MLPENDHGLTEADYALTGAEVAAARAELEAARIDGTTMDLGLGDDGAAETLHVDETEQTITIKRVADVQSVLDWCKGRFNEGIANRHCEFRQIAEIPPDVLDIWAAAKGYKLPPGWMLQKEFHGLVISAAHDSDLSGFRTLAGVYL